MQRLNQINRRPSREERGENYRFVDAEDIEAEEELYNENHPIPKIVSDVDWSTLNAKYSQSPDPTPQGCDAENCNKTEVVKRRQVVMHPTVQVISQGPLISGRLNERFIEKGRMLLWQFYGAVNEEYAVSVRDLYSCLYDRDVNQTEEMRSTLVNFSQTMLDVEYI